MSYKLSKRSLNRLQGVHPDLIKVVELAIKRTPVDFGIIEGLRTVDVPAVEEVLDDQGNVVTPAQPATTREEEYTESVPTGTVTKSVKYSILAQIQGKVIQEQQAIINAQQAQIDAQQATIAAQQTQIDSILVRLEALEAA